MPEAYSPIVRTFCQLRAGLMSRIEVARHEIRPETPLESLVPESMRREVWQDLQQRGLRMPALEWSERDQRRNLLAALRSAASAAVSLQRWSAMLLVFPLAVIMFWATRRRAVHFPPFVKTVGELVIYSTRFADHKDSGYRWTHNEIALKVRMIVAESLGLPLEAIQPETTWAELGALC
jgi:hypothetical protein